MSDPEGTTTMADFTMGLAGGYTAGHVMPMITLAQTWRRLYPDDTVVCYGSADGIEATLLQQFDLPFQALPAHPQFGAGLAGQLRGPLDALRGMIRGGRHMRRRGVDALVCLGGYASLGAGLAAAALGRPLIVFEANAVPGRANTLLARFADLKLAAMPEALAFRGWHDAQLTDMPLRLPPAAPPSSGARAARLLITGGTFGSPTLNRGGVELAAELRRRGVAVELYHQAGEDNHKAVRAAYAAAGVPATVVGFDLELPARWAWADAALCAAGAVSLNEAAAAGTPTLTVPQAAVADGHQEANARAMAARHGIDWLPESAWCAVGIAERLAAMLRQAKRPTTVPSGGDAAVHAIRACCATRRRAPATP